MGYSPQGHKELDRTSLSLSLSVSFLVVCGLEEQVVKLIYKL